MARNYSQEQKDMYLADVLNSLGLELKADPNAINKKRLAEQEAMKAADDITNALNKKYVQDQYAMKAADDIVSALQKKEDTGVYNLGGLTFRRADEEKKAEPDYYVAGGNIFYTDEQMKRHKQRVAEQEAMMKEDSQNFVDRTIDELLGNSIPQDDYISPRKPNTTPDMYDTSLMERGVSYAGGLNGEAIDPMQVLSANNGLTGEAIDPMQVLSANNGFTPEGRLDPMQMLSAKDLLNTPGLDLSAITPVEHKISNLVKYGMMGKDIFDKATGVDESAYPGKSMELFNKQNKSIEAADPEGKLADVNRAKMLSQIASQSDDPAVKARCGAAIKRLLPRETQGLDDITASNFSTFSDKVEQEKIKQQTQLQKQQIANEAKILAAEINARSRENVANTNAGSRENVANINAEAKRYVADTATKSRQYVADMNYQSKIDVANIKAASAETLARLKQNADATATGINEATGDIIPSEGVVGAVQLIEDNPGAFNESAAWLDLGFFRYVGAISSKTVQDRAQVTYALQPIIRDSVQNLMQLFPKGGSGVINTPKEQELFVPVAKAIAGKRGYEILAALNGYYGGLYDEARKKEGKDFVPACSKEEYVNLMMYGNTNGRKGGGKTYLPGISASQASKSEEMVTL